MTAIMQLCKKKKKKLANYSNNKVRKIYCKVIVFMYILIGIDFLITLPNLDVSKSFLPDYDMINTLQYRHVGSILLETARPCI